jgi:hypothetical protein
MRISELLNEAERFRFFKYSFDIDLIRRHVEAKDVKFTKDESFNIVAWAEQILSLRRSAPEKRPASLFMKIDYDHVGKIGDERLNEPIFVVETPDGGIIVDGNHRVAKAYLSGKDTLPALIFPKSELKKLNGPVKEPKAKK